MVADAFLELADERLGGGMREDECLFGVGSGEVLLLLLLLLLSALGFG